MKKFVEQVHAEVNEIRARKGLPPWNFSVGPRHVRGGKFCKSCGTLFNAQGYNGRSICDLCRKAA